MVILKVQIPGVAPANKQVEVLTAVTYSDCITHLLPSERIVAAEILDSLENDPSTGADRLIDVAGFGTSLVRFRSGLYVIYQYHIVADETDQASHKVFKAIFCWRSVDNSGVEGLTFPDWAVL